MEKLGITREEAIQLIADDKAIDRGAKMFTLDPEAEKASKKARQADRKPVVYNHPKKERKPRPEKEEICCAMMDGLTKILGVSDYTITNKEREFSFMHEGTKYKVVLSCPRS